jgi:prostaglandin-E synthase 1
MQHSIGSADNLAFVAYAITCLVLSLNLLLLWVSSGAIRAKSAIAINPEDGARYCAPVSDVDPPAVARILRAHRNAEATIYPFLFVGLIYVLAGGGPEVAVPIFSIFTIARIAHSILYLKAKQPGRTISFAISLLALLLLMLAGWATLLINMS